MKILFASDSFKGSLTSAQIGRLLTAAAHEIFPECETSAVSVADGGEGTMETIVHALGGTWKTVTVPDPLEKTVQARYGLLPGKKALIEMAEASGLPLVPEAQKNAAQTTSAGTGVLIRDALDSGIRDITIAIGGSATNDGGMGAMHALGIQFLDKQNQTLRGCGENLALIDHIDLKGLHPAVRETHFTVMCDVTNPLLGEQGATYTFGPQKGADHAMLERLEHGMQHYASIVVRTLGRDDSGLQGTGAAGGLGFALVAFLGAELRSGIETVLDLLEFDQKLRGVDLVITGEGRMDCQSALGKVASGIGKRCQKAGIPAVALVGGLLPGYETMYDCGIQSVITTVSGPMSVEQAIADSEALYMDAALRLFRLIGCGYMMGQAQSISSP